MAWGTDKFGSWNATPVHSVTITRPFYLAIFECTQGQAKLLKGSYFGNQGYEFKGSNRDRRPVSSAKWSSWRGASADGYCWPNDGSKVNPASLIGLLRTRTGNNEGFDMPTEAEWEYAARAGDLDAWGGDGLKTSQNPSSDPGPQGMYTNSILAVKGRYRFNGGLVDNGDGTYSSPLYDDEVHGTAVVGSYKPNAWGFYDMLGNARECTLDFRNGGFAADDGIDPVGKLVENRNASRILRAMRGGHYSEHAQKCALPFREFGDNSLEEYIINGCRLAWRFPTPAQEE